MSDRGSDEEAIELFGIDRVRLHKQFDLAIQNHDLAAAKRLAVKLCEDINPRKPIDIWRIDVMVRCYAGEMYGWEIGGRR